MHLTPDNPRYNLRASVRTQPKPVPRALPYSSLAVSLLESIFLWLILTLIVLRPAARDGGKERIGPAAAGALGREHGACAGGRPGTRLAGLLYLRLAFRYFLLGRVDHYLVAVWFASSV